MKNLVLDQNERNINAKITKLGTSYIKGPHIKLNIVLLLLYTMGKIRVFFIIRDRPTHAILQKQKNKEKTNVLCSTCSVHSDSTMYATL